MLLYTITELGVDIDEIENEVLLKFMLQYDLI